MPPAKKRPRVEADYSWIGTSVLNASDIQAEHCIRAAGLHTSTPCPLILDIDTGDSRLSATPAPTSKAHVSSSSRSRGSSTSIEIIEAPAANTSATSHRSSSPTPAPADVRVGSLIPSIGLTNGEKKQEQEREKQKEKTRSKPKQTDKAKRQQALAKIGCSAQGCRNNPQCYNHIGIHVVRQVLLREKVRLAR